MSVNPFKPKASNKGPADLCPAGNHPGVLVALIDLGTHLESYQGGPEKKVRKLCFVWEVEAGEEGGEKRFWVAQEYSQTVDEKTGSLSIHTKNKLRKLLEGWRNKAYGEAEDIDLSVFLGRPCLVNVTHKETGTGDNKYTNLVVASVGGVPKGMPKLADTIKPVTYVCDQNHTPPPEGDWVPRLFGATLTQVLERSLEWGGTGRREPKGQGGAERNGRHPVGAGAAPAGREPGDEDDIPF